MIHQLAAAEPARGCHWLLVSQCPGESESTPHTLADKRPVPPAVYGQQGHGKLGVTYDLFHSR